ncbi:flavodoxin family protein [Paramaledivibacter caminithermalis]|uniref:NADPH-dependent FMN reductase n=1 Tax=Paramaledivibacter caminithermalis (strain DSM 15212 / CIP 107654 / DViRD3) TaxID=1121301 RepID=A0A1M6RLQ8_PARC5|nr:flavodoxin family protein [Paramaledivibacter caminithermalis]SHK33340.1 NADPH-dependent FMN reductase [Paramaledivibacter caminithermalis DSM 15212]
MKVLALLGSPRIKGNTDILLEELIKGVKECEAEVHKYELARLRINPCVGCYKCGELGRCIYEDDMKTLYEEFDQADIIIFASPLYFNSVSSISKLMIDRCHALWASKFILNKPMIDINKKRNGIFICTAGAKQGDNGFIGAFKVADLFFKAINIKSFKQLLMDDTDNLNIRNRVDILDKAYIMGKELCKHQTDY